MLGSRYTNRSALVGSEQIGLQQILQNVTNETVNIDDMESLEKALLGSCEEMMRMIRESPDSEFDGAGEGEDDDRDDAEDNNNDIGDGGHHTDTAAAVVSSGSKEKRTFAAENFTSPFNIRVPRKQREQYFVPGINQEPAPKLHDRGTRARLEVVHICCRVRVSQY